MAGIPRPDIDIFRDPTSISTCHKELYEFLQQGYEVPLKDRMEVSLQLARAEMDIGNAAEAEKLLGDCRDYIFAFGKEEDKACIYNTYAMLYATKGQSAEGIAMGIKAVDLFRPLGFPYFVMHSFVVCAHLCSQMCLYAEAMDYMMQAHHAAIGMGNKKQAIMCHLNLNEIRINMLPPADCIRHCLELLPEIENYFTGETSYAEACTYLQLAHLHVASGDIAGADGYAQKSMAVTCRLPLLPPHHLQYINLYAVIAAIAAAKGDERAMLENTAQNTSRSGQANNMVALVDARFFLFRFYLGRNDMVQAKTYLDQGASLIQDDDRSALYLKLQEARCAYYAATGDLANELSSSKLIYEYKLKTQQQDIAHRIKYISAIHEVEMRKKEIIQQKTELAFKTQELNMATYYLQQRNRLLTDLKENITELKKKRSRSDAVFSSLSTKINQALTKEEVENVRFREKLDDANREFISKLHLLYPDLTSGECRMCVLLRSGLNTKDISSLLSTSIRNVENHRLRIRKKLSLSRDANLNLILSEIK